MSCRVMGRKLEDVIINELAAHYKEKQKMIGEFIPTAKNAPVKELYDRFNFQVVSDNDGHKLYELDILEYKYRPYNCYKEVRFEE